MSVGRNVIWELGLKVCVWDNPKKKKKLNFWWFEKKKKKKKKERLMKFPKRESQIVRSLTWKFINKSCHDKSNICPSR